MATTITKPLNLKPDEEVGPPVVRIRNLWTRFGRTVVHQDLNLDIYAGEILSIVGGSGTGKTVLLRQMLGLEHPTSGSVTVFGEDVSSASPEQLQRIRDAVLLKMNMVGLGPGDANKMPSDLSGGMIKRAALARALALEPQLLFLDEPTAGLDPDLSDTFVELIKTLHNELRLTVVMVTHDLDTLFALSSRIAVLAEKHVLAVGPACDVLRVQHPFIKQFFLGPRGQRALEVLEERYAGKESED
jgi:phospholipid/cholesterol/gamma-HCH transport system ATP-binding protein